MDDWRDNAALALALVSRGVGISSQDSEAVLAMLKRLAVFDRGKVKHLRVGFSYVLDELGQAGLTKFLKLAQSKWDMPGNTPETANPSEKKYACVVSILVDKHYPSRSLLEVLGAYVSDLATITSVALVFGLWYDLKVEYDDDLVSIFSRLSSPVWVKKAITKPVSQFGDLTAAHFE